jgi:hypothetical protein
MNTSSSKSSIVGALDVSDPSSELVDAGDKGESYSQSSTMASSGATYAFIWSGETGGVGGDTHMAGTVNCEQFRILFLNSGSVILCSGEGLKIRPRMSFSSSVNGRMVFRKDGSRAKARYVESWKEACFHGLRPQVKLTRMTPSPQTSLGAHL